MNLIFGTASSGVSGYGGFETYILSSPIACIASINLNGLDEGRVLEIYRGQTLITYVDYRDGTPQGSENAIFQLEANVDYVVRVNFRRNSRKIKYTLLANRSYTPDGLNKCTSKDIEFLNKLTIADFSNFSVEQFRALSQLVTGNLNMGVVAKLAKPQQEAMFSLAKLNDQIEGRISTDGAHARYMLNLGKSDDITIFLDGRTLRDSYLTIYDDSGNIYADDDDAGGARDSKLTRKLGGGRTWFIDVRSYYKSDDAGSFILSITSKADALAYSSDSVSKLTASQLRAHIQCGTFQYLDASGITFDQLSKVYWRSNAASQSDPYQYLISAFSPDQIKHLKSEVLFRPSAESKMMFGAMSAEQYKALTEDQLQTLVKVDRNDNIHSDYWNQTIIESLTFLQWSYADGIEANKTIISHIGAWVSYIAPNTIGLLSSQAVESLSLVSIGQLKAAQIINLAQTKKLQYLNSAGLYYNQVKVMIGDKTVWSLFNENQLNNVSLAVKQNLTTGDLSTLIKNNTFQYLNVGGLTGGQLGARAPNFKDQSSATFYDYLSIKQLDELDGGALSGLSISVGINTVRKIYSRGIFAYLNGAALTVDVLNAYISEGSKLKFINILSAPQTGQLRIEVFSQLSIDSIGAFSADAIAQVPDENIRYLYIHYALKFDAINPSFLTEKQLCSPFYDGQILLERLTLDQIKKIDFTNKTSIVKNISINGLRRFVSGDLKSLNELDFSGISKFQLEKVDLLQLTYKQLGQIKSNILNGYQLRSLVTSEKLKYIDAKYLQISQFEEYYSDYFPNAFENGGSSLFRKLTDQQKQRLSGDLLSKLLHCSFDFIVSDMTHDMLAKELNDAGSIIVLDYVDDSQIQFINPNVVSQMSLFELGKIYRRGLINKLNVSEISINQLKLNVSNNQNISLFVLLSNAQIISLSPSVIAAISADNSMVQRLKGLSSDEFHKLNLSMTDSSIFGLDRYSHVQYNSITTETWNSYFKRNPGGIQKSALISQYGLTTNLAESLSAYNLEYINFPSKFHINTDVASSISLYTYLKIINTYEHNFANVQVFDDNKFAAIGFDKFYETNVHYKIIAENSYSDMDYLGDLDLIFRSLKINPTVIESNYLDARSFEDFENTINTFLLDNKLNSLLSLSLNAFPYKLSKSVQSLSSLGASTNLRGLLTSILYHTARIQANESLNTELSAQMAKTNITLNYAKARFSQYSVLLGLFQLIDGPASILNTRYLVGGIKNILYDYRSIQAIPYKPLSSGFFVGSELMYSVANLIRAIKSGKSSDVFAALYSVGLLGFDIKTFLTDLANVNKQFEYRFSVLPSEKFASGILGSRFAKYAVNYITIGAMVIADVGLTVLAIKSLWDDDKLSLTTKIFQTIGLVLTSAVGYTAVVAGGLATGVAYGIALGIQYVASFQLNFEKNVNNYMNYKNVKRSDVYIDVFGVSLVESAEDVLVNPVTSLVLALKQYQEIISNPSGVANILSKLTEDSSHQPSIADNLRAYANSGIDELSKSVMLKAADLAADHNSPMATCDNLSNFENLSDDQKIDYWIGLATIRSDRSKILRQQLYSSFLKQELAIRTNFQKFQPLYGKKFIMLSKKFYELNVSLFSDIRKAQTYIDNTYRAAIMQQFDYDDAFGRILYNNTILNDDHPYEFITSGPNYVLNNDKIFKQNYLIHFWNSWSIDSLDEFNIFVGEGVGVITASNDSDLRRRNYYFTTNNNDDFRIDDHSATIWFDFNRQKYDIQKYIVNDGSNYDYRYNFTLSNGASTNHDIFAGSLNNSTIDTSLSTDSYSIYANSSNSNSLFRLKSYDNLFIKQSSSVYSLNNNVNVDINIVDTSNASINRQSQNIEFDDSDLQAKNSSLVNVDGFQFHLKSMGDLTDLHIEGYGRSSQAIISYTVNHVQYELSVWDNQFKGWGDNLVLSFKDDNNKTLEIDFNNDIVNQLSDDSGCSILVSLINDSAEQQLEYKFSDAEFYALNLIQKMAGSGGNPGIDVVDPMAKKFSANFAVEELSKSGVVSTAHKHSFMW